MTPWSGHDSATNTEGAARRRIEAASDIIDDDSTAGEQRGRDTLPRRVSRGHRERD